MNSLEELYSQIPSQIRLKNPLDLDNGLSEHEVKKLVQGLAEKNLPVDKMNSFLGAGCYDHYLPAPVSFILSRSQFLTAYTPYQAECSQGILQAIYEYQSYICLLTGMDISNASLFDGASALAEAALMSLRITRRKKILVSSSLHPDYRKVLDTYLSGFDFHVQVVDSGNDGFVKLFSLKQVLNDEVACCLFQSPNFFGLIENVSEISTLVKEKQALSVMVTNPMSLALLKEPAELGVDIVCGDGQPLGCGLNFGGPSFGFLATRNEYCRQLPGRIVGKTLDKEKREAYCLTLQTREQHIRREKATSNICSNQSLKALAACVYLALMGREGLKRVGLNSFKNVQYLYQRLKEVRGVIIPYPGRIFNEFLWEVKDAKKIFAGLSEKNIIGGYYVGDSFPEHKDGILSCCTEKKTKNDIDNFVNYLGELLHG